MDQSPLVREEIDAGAELIRRFQQYAPVKAAFWMKSCERPFRYLYIASDQINDENFDRAYGEIGRITREMRNPNLSSFWVKVINGNHPTVRDIVDLYKRYPGAGAVNYRASYLGDTPIDDAYIYPVPPAVPAANG